MSSTVSPEQSPASGPAPAAAVQRTPFYLESRGQGLFAWLHSPEQGPRSHHGVVLCPTVGYEQIPSHRSLRHLADALARAGFAALRFDYQGTGDSSGTDEDADRYATWLANVHDARRWLQAQLGCPRVSLLGVRLGAALAAQAAAEKEVDALVLWAPVVKGRSFVREMTALSLTASGGAPPPGLTTGDLEPGGFVLTGETVQDLSRLDLTECWPRCRRALIVARADLPPENRLLQHLQALGIDAEQAVQPGYADMMAEPHYTKVPHQAIAYIVSWLRAAVPAEGPGDTGIPSIDIEQPKANPPFQESVLTVPKARRHIRECVMRIGQQSALFGIVSEPVGATPDSRPTVVLLNAGSSYRVGPHRLYVTLTRCLALEGFRCLRMDLSGLGDSACPDPDRENDPYPATAFRDIDLTLNHLQSALGVRRVVLLGLCSGAYAAFQSAAQMANPVLVESVLLNPLTFYWKEGMSLEASPARQVKSYHHYMTSVWQPRKWLKFLSGRSKIGLAGAAKMLLGRWRLRRQARRTAPPHPGGTAGAVPLCHPPVEDLPGDLERIAQAGRHLAVFLAPTDPGYRILTTFARRQVNRLRGRGKMSLSFVAGADHTFSGRDSRRALAQALTEHLCRRYPEPGRNPGVQPPSAANP